MGYNYKTEGEKEKMNLNLILGIILGVVLIVGFLTLSQNKEIPKEEPKEERLIQGPVPEGYDEPYFRKTGITKPLEVKE